MTEILDDLRAADEITRRFERHYWRSSADFYALYQAGQAVEYRTGGVTRWLFLPLTVREDS